MQSKIQITANMKMADIVHMNHNYLHVINRFCIPLGFGDQSIDEVCQKAKLPTDLFLTICNINSLLKSSL